mgnify:CR=1 FL=1
MASKQMLADSLGYHLKTHSLKDNLAMYSRFPLEAIALERTFQNRILPKITLPNGKRIMFVDCWLRYAYRPEYTSGYAEKGLDPSVWVAEGFHIGITRYPKHLYQGYSPEP